MKVKTVLYLVVALGLMWSLGAVPAAATPIIDIQPEVLPAATVGVYYSQQLIASGGVGPYTWWTTGAGLPAGWVLNGGTGVLECWSPAEPGTRISASSGGVAVLLKR